MNDDQIIWQGTPSQIANLHKWGWSALLIGSLDMGLTMLFKKANFEFPATHWFLWAIWLFFAWWRLVTVSCHKITITKDRLLVSTGVLNQHTEAIELYRIRDQDYTRSFLQRIGGSQTIRLVTEDATAPRVTLPYIFYSEEFNKTVRDTIEKCRIRNKVRTLEMGDNFT